MKAGSNDVYVLCLGKGSEHYVVLWKHGTMGLTGLQDQEDIG